MDTKELFKVLAEIYPLSGGFKESLEKELIQLSLPQNHLLLEAPKIADHAYFLNKGFAMGYTFVNGKKSIEAFWKAGQIIVSSNSFFEQLPSLEYIQLMQ